MTTIAAVLGGAALWLLPSAVLYFLLVRHERFPHCRCGEWAVHPGSSGTFDEGSGMLHEIHRCFPTREHIGEIRYYDEEE